MYIYIILFLQLLGIAGSLQDLMKNNYPRVRSAVPAGYDWFALILGTTLFMWGIHLVILTR
jgi:hypothetical protein